MTRSELFSKAHEMTRDAIARAPHTHRDYRTTFAAALQWLYAREAARAEVTDLEAAQAIADRINDEWGEDGYVARAWQGTRGSCPVRVYVRRFLSRGRRQEMGHLYIRDGLVDAGALTRRRAGLRDLAFDALRPLGLAA